MEDSGRSRAFTRRRVAVLASVLVCALWLCFAFLPTLASARIAYFDGNLSRAAEGTDNKTMVVCDGSGDGNSAFTNYSRFRENFTRELYDRSGANDNDCGRDYDPNGIEFHETCEDRAFSRPCGDRRRH